MASGILQLCLNEENASDVFIPANVRQGLFTQFAIDNLDIRENTSDGTTMHGTTHNIYQHTNEDDHDAACIPMSKKPHKAACGDSDQFQARESGLMLRDHQLWHHDY